MKIFTQSDENSMLEKGLKDSGRIVIDTMGVDAPMVVLMKFVKQNLISYRLYNPIIFHTGKSD